MLSVLLFLVHSSREFHCISEENINELHAERETGQPCDWQLDRLAIDTLNVNWLSPCVTAWFKFKMCSLLFPMHCNKNLPCDIYLWLTSPGNVRLMFWIIPRMAALLMTVLRLVVMCVTSQISVMWQQVRGRCSYVWRDNHWQCCHLLRMPTLAGCCTSICMPLSCNLYCCATLYLCLCTTSHPALNTPSAYQEYCICKFHCQYRYYCCDHFRLQCENLRLLGLSVHSSMKINIPVNQIQCKCTLKLPGTRDHPQN